MFKLPKDQSEVLHKLRSRAHFRHRGTVTQCRLIDELTGNPWHTAEVTGEGDDGEKLALSKALSTASPKNRPLTPAEAQAEINRLQSENEAFREKYGEPTTPPAKKPRAKFKAEEPQDGWGETTTTTTDATA